MSRKINNFINPLYKSVSNWNYLYLISSFYCWNNKIYYHYFEFRKHAAFMAGNRDIIAINFVLSSDSDRKRDFEHELLWKHINVIYGMKTLNCLQYHYIMHRWKFNLIIFNFCRYSFYLLLPLRISSFQFLNSNFSFHVSVW